MKGGAGNEVFYQVILTVLGATMTRKALELISGNAEKFLAPDPLWSLGQHLKVTAGGRTVQILKKGVGRLPRRQPAEDQGEKLCKC